MISCLHPQSPRLHSYFTPGMMLQRDVPTTVWGYEALGEVTAALFCQEDSQDSQGREDSQDKEDSQDREDNQDREDREDREDLRDRWALVTRTREDGVWEAELPPWPAGSVCQFEVTFYRTCVSANASTRVVSNYRFYQVGLFCHCRTSKVDYFFFV